MPKRVITIDLYCGIGGATQGMIDAGATVVLSIDGWKVAKHFHERNYPDVPFVQRMLGEEPDEDLQIIIDALLDAGDRDDIHIHIHGSPPCQAFSTAAGGHRRPLADGLANINHFLWLVDELKARDLCDSWSMENVPAARRHLKHLPYEMILASEHGAPQARKRWFAGEGWKTEPIAGALAWNEVVDDPSVPVGSVLNVVGAAWSGSDRAKSSDSAWGSPSRTITRQLPVIRKEKTDGTFEKIRGLTMDEVARLQGFPAGMNLTTPTDQRDLGIALGNCVCPPAMAAVINGIFM